MTTPRRAYSTTEVPVSKTMDEIRRQLIKYGIEQVQITERVASQSAPGMIQVGFITPNNRLEVRMRIVIPEIPYGSTKRQVEGHGKAEARALFHVVKNKLAGTEYGIETIEIAFLPYLLTAGNATVAERPDLLDHFAQGRDLAQLPANATEHMLALPERAG